MANDNILTAAEIAELQALDAGAMNAPWRSASMSAYMDGIHIGMVRIGDAKNRRVEFNYR